MPQRRTIPVGLLLATLVLVGCGGSATHVVSSEAPSSAAATTNAVCRPSPAEDRGTSLIGTPSLEDWFLHGDHVAEVLVVDARVAELAFEPQEGPTFVRARDELLEVRAVYDGALAVGDRIWIRSHDFVVVDSDGTPVEGQCFLLTVGDSALVSLVGDGTDPDVTRTALTTGEAVVIIDGEEILDTGRSNRAVRRLEGMTRAAASEALSAAGQRSAGMKPSTPAPPAPVASSQP
jgi:hypothetical protein